MTTAAQTDQRADTLSPAEEAAVAVIAAYLASRAAVASVRLPGVLVDRLVALGMSRRAVRAAARMTLSRSGFQVASSRPAVPLVNVKAARAVVNGGPRVQARMLVVAAKRITVATTPRLFVLSASQLLQPPATSLTARVASKPHLDTPATSTSTVKAEPGTFSVGERLKPERGLKPVELSVVDELAAYLGSPEAVDAGVLPVGLVNRLESLGLSKRAIRIAARLVLEPPLTGRNRWGSPGKVEPGADVSAVRKVAGDEPTWRARYLLEAAKRLTDAEQFAQALAAERRYLRLHREAGIGRRKGAAQVDAAAKRANGYLVWVGGTCDECRPLDGQVFLVGAMPLPPLHPHCRCGVRPL